MTQYSIPSANGYDWSTFPPAFADGSKAQWLEQMNSNNVIPDVDAAGINHATQARDNDLTFIVGALVGLAGGSVVGGSPGECRPLPIDDNSRPAQVPEARPCPTTATVASRPFLVNSAAPASVTGSQRTRARTNTLL